jgi:hypothetical protein
VENDNSSKIINGFCFLKEDSVVFVDLISERTENFKKSFFQKFIDENNIDEYCIFLANREGGFVTPLYKYKLQTAKSKINIKASSRSIDEMITLCYKVCIEMFQKKL